MPTGRKPVNIPAQRYGAVGSLAVNGEEVVTYWERIWTGCTERRWGSPAIVAPYSRDFAYGVR